MHRLLSLALNRTYLFTSRHSFFALNRTYLPTSSSPTLNKTYSPTSHKLISYSSIAIKDEGKISDKLSSVTKDTNQVSDKVDQFLEQFVYKNKRSEFKFLREIERKDIELREIERKNMENFFKLEIANIGIKLAEQDKDLGVKLAEKDKDLGIKLAEKDKDLGIKLAEKDKDIGIKLAEKDKDIAMAAVKAGYVNLCYLRLKGTVHLRGVFEQWELVNLSSLEGNRETKWTKYLNTHKDVLKDFQNFWPNPNEIGVGRVALEMKNFYKWLSERIHNAYATGDCVEWRRTTLTPLRNKIAEFMCKDLNIEFRIVEPVEKAEPIDGEFAQTIEPVEEAEPIDGEFTQTKANNSLD